MNKSSKLLFRTIAGLCFCGVFAAYSQKADISIKVDFPKKEIITFVALSEIPPDVDIVWQQKIPKEAHFASSPQSSKNADGQMIVMSFSRYVLASSMNFSFVCKMDYIESELLWGEAAIIYTDKNEEEQVIEYPAKLYIFADYDKLTQQEAVNSDDNVEAKSSNMIIVTADDRVNAKINTDMDENKSVVQAVAEAEKTIESESAKLPLAQETVANREETPTLTVVPQEPAQDIPVKEDKKAAEKIEERITTSIKSNLQKTIPPPKSGYYVQVSTVKSKRNFSEIRNYVHLLDEDNLAELRKGTFYIYLVGPFSTKEDAYDKLEYYKEYSGDAFVRKL